ncbi:MAG: hypothetical protein ACR2G4_09440 [Pyrinomonadaceae bacterium]
MHHLVCSRRALVSVCALAFLLLFYVVNSSTTRREAARAASGGGAWQQQPQSSQQDVPADLRAAIEEARYRLEPDAVAATGEAGYRAPNPAQGWHARFGAEGLSIETRAGEGRAAQRFAMRLAAYGYGERAVPVGRAEMVAAKNRVEYRRGSLVEWYLNERRGVEQGFTLQEPPASAGEGARGVEPLSVRLAIEGSLRAELGAGGESVEFVDAAGERVLSYDQLAAYDAGGRELPSRMRVDGEEVRLEVDDAGAQYPLTIDPFVQQQRLQASDAAVIDFFGGVVAISGETAIVGVSNDDHSGGQDTGSAYVFTRSNGVWTQQQRLQASDAAPGDFFGRSVSVSGETAIVGATGDENIDGAAAGSAYVFVRNNGVWTEQQRLQASDAAFFDDFGISVAISGETAVVGAYLDDNSGGQDAGSAYVFTRSNGVWTQQQRLQASDAARADLFGNSVSVSGDTAIVGAFGDDNSGGFNAGSAYVFTRSNGVWTQQQRLQASDAADSDFFGASIAISGETAIIGAYEDDNSGGSNVGSAYVFTRNNGMWTEQQRLQASDAATFDGFGLSVAISGDTAVIGAARDDHSGGQDTGSAYVFTRSNGVWIQQQRLQASDAAPGDFFGVSVSVSGETAIVGAPRDDNSGGQDAGSAYVFVNDDAPPAAGQIIISEFRTRGPGGFADDFFELYNTTGTAITVAAPDGTSGWTFVTKRGDGGAQNSLTIPAGTIIPARGHYLMVGSAYSLGTYPAGNGATATSDNAGTIDGFDDGGMALFQTTDTGQFNTANRLDAVGFTTQTDTLYREGAGISQQATSDVEHSFVRKLSSGTPQDSNVNNAADFLLIATNPAALGGNAVLGAPGPENTTSPVQSNATIKASLIDGMQPSFASPNRVRSGAADATEPANSTRGTFKIRRRFTNITGQPVSRLRFRIVDITTAPRPNASTADLRVLRNSGGSVTLSNGIDVPLTDLTREEPPAQTANGGGLNTTLSATLAQPIPNAMSVNVEFNLGVIEDGNFRFFVNVEALTNPPTNPPATMKAGARGKAAKSKTRRATP